MDDTEIIRVCELALREALIDERHMTAEQVDALGITGQKVRDAPRVHFSRPNADVSIQQKGPPHKVIVFLYKEGGLPDRADILIW